MKSKYFLLLFLTLPIVFLGCWMVSLHLAATNAQIVIVRMRGFDPVDLLSGHYLYLRPDWELTDCQQFANNQCPKKLFEKSYRYYLPEHDAQALNHKINIMQDLEIDIVFALQKNRKPLVKSLLINNYPWKDWLSNQSAEQLPSR